MKFLDRLAFNRLVSIILNFILAIIKVFAPQAGKELENNHPIPPLPKPPLRKRKPLFPPKKSGDTNE
jgi:hypothetical protein